MNAMETKSEHGGHERKDADVIALFMVGALLCLGGIIVILSCWALIHVLTLRQNAREKAAVAATQQGWKFPAPNLVVEPGSDFQPLRSAQEKELNSYGWIDRKSETVRIPIDRAMQLLVERGLPDVGANRTPLQLMQERPQQGETPTPTPTPEAMP
jgi:hypothetical protein